KGTTVVASCIHQALTGSYRYTTLRDTAHAGYTRRQDPAVSEKRLMIEKLRGISGVKYEHRTSRAGDPHVHSHVLLANKQLCQDGKIRTLDSKGIYHEARAAGMVYQATLREILSRKLGFE